MVIESFTTYVNSPSKYLYYSGILQMQVDLFVTFNKWIEFVIWGLDYESSFILRDSFACFSHRNFLEVISNHKLL